MAWAAGTIACRPLPQPVEREGRSLNRKATVDGGYTSEVHVMDIGMDDIAEDHMPHRLWWDPRSLDRLADDGCAQFGRGLVFQPAAILSNRGTHTAQYDDFCLCHVLFSPS